MKGVDVRNGSFQSHSVLHWHWGVGGDVLVRVSPVFSANYDMVCGAAYPCRLLRRTLLLRHNHLGYYGLLPQVEVLLREGVGI